MLHCWAVVSKVPHFTSAFASSVQVCNVIAGASKSLLEGPFLLSMSAMLEIVSVVQMCCLNMLYVVLSRLL